MFFVQKRCIQGTAETVSLHYKAPHSNAPSVTAHSIIGIIKQIKPNSNRRIMTSDLSNRNRTVSLHYKATHNNAPSHSIIGIVPQIKPDCNRTIMTRDLSNRNPRFDNYHKLACKSISTSSYFKLES